MSAKPLFVPLKTKWFDRFADGTKDTEYRKYGPGWNERTVYVGRRVILSKGYSGARLDAVVVSFHLVEARHVPRATELYPPQTTLIAIKLNVGGESVDPPPWSSGCSRFPCPARWPDRRSRLPTGPWRRRS